MTVVNVIAIILLTPTILSVTHDYHTQRDKGIEPEFKVKDVKVQGKCEDGIWD
jgi:AGCS family alanine or glycine:cation symporter